MKRFFSFDLVERLLFTAIIVGVLLSLFSLVRIVDMTRKISTNPAAQFHESGEQLTVQTTTEARGLVAADVELRRLKVSRYQMMIFGGAGLVLLGIGWLGYDLLNSRRTNPTDPIDSVEGVA